MDRKAAVVDTAAATTATRSKTALQPRPQRRGFLLTTDPQNRCYNTEKYRSCEVILFRRPFRDGNNNRPILPPALANELRLANQLLAEGQPAKAAALFSQLAEQTAAMGRPRQAGRS